MIKTILVPSSGSSTDDSVFATAYAIAQPLGAHLEFFHVRLTSCEAALRAPHVEFAMGAALSSALSYLRDQEAGLSAKSQAQFKAFCGARELDIRTTLGGSGRVSASWSEETNDARNRLLFRARHSDLVVLGRPKHVDYMPSMLIQDLLVGGGRPIVIAADVVPRTCTGTILVGWKETPEAARALTAAMPLLERAQRVVLISVTEDNQAGTPALKHLASQLAWHGINPEFHILDGKINRAAAQLQAAAVAHQADMLVIGGFGRGAMREFLFGGVTQAFIDQAGLPVFMLH
jgi:nucleotide-binding universal stress UspA family protein